MKVIDMHCDTIGSMYGRRKKSGKTEGLYENELHIDIRKMIKGDYLLQNFAMFVHLEETHKPFEEAMEMIDLYYQELEENKEWIAPVYSFQDIVNNQANGKMSAMLTIEEGEVLQGNLAYLRDFYRLGVRMIALTWNFDNQIGYPNLTKINGEADWTLRSEKGLTEFGIETIQEMEHLGMLVDVSHLSDGGFWDVLRYTKQPFVASHSNAAAVQNICRNLTDEMLKALGERGGVSGLNFCPRFVTENAGEKCAEEMLDGMAAHLRHMADVGGIEVCALGSDFDGIATNIGLPDASCMQQLVGALKKKGFHESEIEKIFYKNVLRVYKEVLK